MHHIAANLPSKFLPNAPILFLWFGPSGIPNVLFSHVNKCKLYTMVNTMLIEGWI